MSRLEQDDGCGIERASKVRIASHNKGSVGKGLHAKGETEGPAGWQQLPAGGYTLTGIHAGQLPQQMPDLAGPYPKASGKGIHAGNAPAEKRPILAGEYSDGHLIHNSNHLASGRRPQMADYDLGRGVNVRPPPGSTCDARRAWILDWFGRLRDRLRNVRVCCGDWLRVCSSESVTTRLGVTGVFLDPPYGAKAGRSKNLYSTDSLTVADQARAWCLERGSRPLMRIVLCGYEGEGHEELERHGWRVFAWKARGGYGNRSEAGRANARKERLWVSPHCLTQPSLFDALPDGAPAPAADGDGRRRVRLKRGGAR